MNPLEDLHKKIDEESWDIKDVDLINKSFQDVNGKLTKFNEKELLHKSEREREVFSFSKSPDGISWKLQGTKTLQDGTIEPMEWPDLKSWSEDDFSYIYERFNETENIFSRSEYGLVLYFSGKLNLSDTKILFEDLYNLSKRYYEGLRNDENGLYYAFSFYNAVALSLSISFYKKNAPGFSHELSKVLLFIEEVHIGWQKTGKYLLRTVIDLTAFIIQYYSDAVNVVNVKGFFERNNLAAEEECKTYTWGAIYIIDENIRLGKLINTNIKNLIKRKAELYEKLAVERSKGDLAIVTFIETSLRLYKEIGDAKNIKRLEDQFNSIKNEVYYQSFGFDLPNEEVERIKEKVQNEIKENEEKEILRNFVICPMYLPLDSIKQNAENWKRNNVPSFMSGLSISDKFGNRIARYPESSDDWAFLQAYSFQFQSGTMTLVYFFLEAFKEEKITFDGIKKFLENTWIGQEINRSYNNQNVTIVPFELIKPSINLFMKELSLWKEKPGYNPEIIPIIDSLVLKVEALLRYFCGRLGISTFKLKDNGLVIESNLDEILAALEDKPDRKTNFLEEDRKFIKYILSEKAGENLRNKIAHGLMDSFEYSIDKAILAFTIIMRLSKYTFKISNK